MFLKLLILFVCVPLIELYLLFQLAGVMGAGSTLLLVIVTGIIGSALAKREGIVAWHRFHAALGEGRMPSREIQDGLMIIFAAALLLTPGMITDAVGFLLLIPIGRDVVRRWVLPHLFRGFTTTVQIQSTTFQNGTRPSYDDQQTVEGRAVEGRAVDGRAVERD